MQVGELERMIIFFMINLPQNKTGNKKIHIEQTTYKGTNKLLNEARIGLDEALTSKNLILVGDGQWKPRWGTAYYGASLSDTIDGAAEYVKSDGTTEIIAIAGGVAYKSTDGGAWSSISGATFTADVQCYFMQITGYLYIANGTDSLARYNGTVLSTYNSINAPTGLSGVKSSTLSAGSTIYYAQVTALNEIGETTGSTEASCAVNEARDAWTSGDKITWSWTALSNAQRYQLYISDEEGDETLT